MIKETTPQIPLTITRTSIFTGFAALLAVGLGLVSGESAQVQPHSPAGTFTEQKVTASDGTANTFFGSAAAIKQTTAVIGADGDASFRGSAYVFNKTGDIWTEGQKLVPSDGLAGDEFGYRVALDNGYLLVTAFSATVNGVVAQGAAYAFTNAAELPIYPQAAGTPDDNGGNAF